MVSTDVRSRVGVTPTVPFGVAVVAVVVLGLVEVWRLLPAAPAQLIGGATAIGVGVVGVVGAPLVARDRVQPADWVTLGRLVLTGGCATLAVIALAGAIPPRPWLAVLLAVPALTLDLADGWVARRTGTPSAAGAAFDNGVDAALVAVLALLVAPAVGWWVLLVGAARYVFVAASWARPHLAGTLPPSRFRRLVGALQGTVLVVAAAPVVPVDALAPVVGVALALLVVSFGRDAAELERARRRAAEPGPATAGDRVRSAHEVR